MTVKTRPIETTIGDTRRLSLPRSVIERAHARPGSGLIVNVVGDGVVELRVRPERTVDDLFRLYQLTVPIEDLEASLREEERRLAGELR